MQRMQKPRFQTQTGQNIHEMGLPACTASVLKPHLEFTWKSAAAQNRTERARLQRVRHAKRRCSLWVSFRCQVSVRGAKASFCCDSLGCVANVFVVSPEGRRSRWIHGNFKHFTGFFYHPHPTPSPGPACAAHLWRWCWSLGPCRCGRSGTPVGPRGRWLLSKEAGRLQKRCRGSEIQPDGDTNAKRVTKRSQETRSGCNEAGEGCLDSADGRGDGGQQPSAATIPFLHPWWRGNQIVSPYWGRWKPDWCGSRGWRWSATRSACCCRTPGGSWETAAPRTEWWSWRSTKLQKPRRKENGLRREFCLGRGL